MKYNMFRMGLAAFAICWRYVIMTRGSTFVRLPESRREGSWSRVSGLQTSLMCCSYCQQQPNCFCVNYNKEAGLCEIVTEELVRENDAVHDQAWTVFYILANVADVDIKSLATASQSSSFSKSPSVAIDGNKTPYWTGGSCIHTDFSQEEWWMADFGKVYVVTGIEVVIRIDQCCRGRFRNIQVLLSDTLTDSVNTCATYVGPPSGNPINIMCVQPFEGRFLKIQRTGETSVVMDFCEVDFF